MTVEMTRGLRPSDPDYWRALKAPAEEVRAILEHPAPEHTSRDPWPAGLELPQGARLLRKEAEHAGWAVSQQYSRGWSVHGITGQPSAYGARIALVMRHPETGNRCVVVYWTKTDGKTAFESAIILGPGLPPYAGCNATEAKEFVIIAGRVLPAWVDAVRWRNTLARVQGKVWADYHAGLTPGQMADKHEITKEQAIKIVQDGRAAGKGKPAKASAKKESGG